MKIVTENLSRHGFSVRLFGTAKDARAAALELMPAGCSVGVGGSMTVQQMGLAPALQQGGRNVHWHWLVPPEQRAQVQQAAHRADFYVLSANAVTEDGELWNIDGSANRLGTMLYGPPQVLILCGRNKIVPNGEAALERIKAVACPQNARRLKLNTPCAVTGRCNDCASPQRMCGALVRLMRPVGGRTFHVWLIDEDLGY
jgi:hypothetical protein